MLRYLLPGVSAILGLAATVGQQYLADRPEETRSGYSSVVTPEAMASIRRDAKAILEAQRLADELPSTAELIAEQTEPLTNLMLEKFGKVDSALEQTLTNVAQVATQLQGANVSYAALEAGLADNTAAISQIQQSLITLKSSMAASDTSVIQSTVTSHEKLLHSLQESVKQIQAKLEVKATPEAASRTTVSESGGVTVETTEGQPSPQPAPANIQTTQGGTGSCGSANRYQYTGTAVPASYPMPLGNPQPDPQFYMPVGIQQPSYQPQASYESSYQNVSANYQFSASACANGQCPPRSRRGWR